ncbi:MAG: iron ABC transporter permease [Proteobacteria bacterium]|nr:iron ABC transporter permease [Pseudomonadota bacterium]
MIRQIPGQVATVVIGLILFVFVAYPLGSVLVESFVVSGPMTVFEIREMTLDALDLMEPKAREKTVSRWIKGAKPRDRMEATAAALELIGEGVPWDRKAAFDKQIEGAKKAVAALDAGKRGEYEAQFTIAYVMLKKRIPLAFKVKAKLSEDQFDKLRTGTHEGVGLRHYFALFEEARLQKGLRNSLLIAIISCTITTFLAYIIAYGVNRGVFPVPNLVRYGVLTPLVSPPVMIATAAILMFGRQGAFTKGLLDQTLGWINADVDNLYGISGVIVAEVFSFLPAAFIIMDNVLSKHDGRVEEAAASQGASPWQVFTRVTLPLSMPGLRRTIILVFILAMTDFGNPLVIGKDIPVLAGILYDEMIGFQNTKLSAALAMWMVVPALSAFFLLERIGRKKRYDTGDSGGGPPELPVPFSARAVIIALTGAVLGLVVILYGTIVVASFVKIWGVNWGFTPHHYTSVEAVPGFESDYEGMGIIWDSFKVSIIAAPVGGLLALVVAYIVERVRPVGGNLISFVTLLPAILPHILFGIGYIIAFNFPFGQKELALTGTMSILVLNLMFGHIYVGVLAGRAVLQRMDASVDEAAEILGASLVQRFTRVTLPMMRHAALLGTLYVFVQSMTSLSSIVFLVSPGNDLAAVAILDSAIGSYYGYASSLSVTMLLIVFAMMGGMWWFERYGPAWARLSAHEAGRA